MKKGLVLSLFFGILFIFMILSISAFSLPADRQIDWSQSGVPGGIPSRTNICATLNSGATASQINSAIQNCNNGVVFLNAGTYTITGTINLNKNNVTLRGAGPGQTIIVANSNMGELIIIGSVAGEDSPVSISSGYTKGSISLTLASIGSISVGDYIYVSEKNDPSIPVTAVGVEGTCTHCSVTDYDGGEYLRGQFVRVTSQSGTTIGISPAMYYTFSSSLSPRALEAKSMTQYVGLEDLTIRNGPNVQSYPQNINILMVNLAYSWVKNINIERCGSRCIHMWSYNHRNEIRDNLLNGCVNRVESDQCYGTLIGAAATANLIENNIYNSTISGPILAWAGSSGNVIAYNYIYDAHRTHNQASWFWADTWTHGAHSSYNLLEGNVMTCFNADIYWGSHSYNTFFRNRMTSKADLISYLVDDVQNVAAFHIQAYNRYYTFMGNVLGTSGFNNLYETKLSYPNPPQKPIYITGTERGGDVETFNTMLRSCNYDFVTNSFKKCGDTGEPPCQGVSNSCALPSSLYYSSKPSWWGNSQWPAFGPDPNTPTTLLNGKIPAQIRFEGNGEPPADITPPVRSSGSPSGNLSAGTTSTTISLNTNEVATCRYSTTAEISYSSMANNFSTTGSTTHSQLIIGLTDGNTYNYYVKCIDNYGNADPDDYLINFYVSYSTTEIVTLQEMLSAYQQYKRNEVGILYFLDKLKNWIVFW